MLHRVGEKLLEWTDVDPPVEKILQIVSLWWFTETFPRSIYPYREVPPHTPPPRASGAHANTVRVQLFSPNGGVVRSPPTIKPFGYSIFPKEVVPTPKKWVANEVGDKLVWFGRHDRVCSPPPLPKSGRYS